MTRTVLLALSLAIVLLFSAAVPAPAEGMDVLVMVDTSESMFPYFDNLVQYLVRDLLEERLRPGDSFHLLSFAGEPEIELGVDIDDNLSVEKIIGRILLLQPLGKYTDLVSAIQYLYTYVKVLPQKNPKTILLLTDGIHDPPPGSPYYGWSPERVKEELLASAREIRREGWSVHILQVPSALTSAGAIPAPGAVDLQATLGGEPAGRATPGAAAGSAAVAGTAAAGPAGPAGPTASAPSSPPGDVSAPGRADAGSPQRQAPAFLDDLARTLGTEVVPYNDSERETITSRTTGLPLLKFPGGLGKVGRLFSAPFRVQNFLDQPIILKLVGVRTVAAGGRKVDLLARPVTVTVPAKGEAVIHAPVRLPSGLADGENSLDVELVFSDDTDRVAPRHGTLRFSYSQGILAGRFLLMGLLYAALAAVVVYCLIRLVLAVRMRVESRPAAPFRRALAAAPEGRSILMSVFFREMKMVDKAVQLLRPGSPRSVGGTGSAFAVRSIPLPKRIADLAVEGEILVLRPRRPQCLPGTEGPIVDCLERPIEVVNLKGQHLRLLFQEYVSPLDEINRIMLSIRRPTLPPPPPPARAPVSGRARPAAGAGLG